MHKYLHLVYSGSCSTLPLVSQTQNCTTRLGVILHNDRISPTRVPLLTPICCAFKFR